MTSDPQHTPVGPPGGAAPAPDPTPRLVDRWDDSWRSPAAGGVVGVLTLPAVAMVLVGLVVLALEGVATWLLVVAAALVTTALGAVGTTVGLRRGHPGVVHRLALLTWVWGVLVIAAGVVVALRPDVPSRGAVAVLLVLGGAYTVVLGLGLWGAARVMPVPDEPARDAATPTGAATPTDDGPASDGPRSRGTGSHSTGSRGTVPDDPAGDDDEELAEWPEWGGADPTSPAASGHDAGRDPSRARPQTGARTASSEATSLPGRPAAPAPGRSTGPTPARATGRTPSRASTPAPARPTAPAPPRDEVVVDAVVVEEHAEPSTPPQRRSVTSAGGAGVRRTPQPPGPVTERIERQDGDEGPPTQRIPPVG